MLISDHIALKTLILVLCSSRDLVHFKQKIRIVEQTIQQYRSIFTTIIFIEQCTNGFDLIFWVVREIPRPSDASCKIPQLRLVSALGTRAWGVGSIPVRAPKNG